MIGTCVCTCSCTVHDWVGLRYKWFLISGISYRLLPLFIRSLILPHTLRVQYDVSRVEQSGICSNKTLSRSLFMYRLQKKWSCLRKISWKSTWTFFGPQRSIFIQFVDTRARFTSQGYHSIIRSQSKARVVPANHLNRRPQSYRPRARTYFWVLRVILRAKIGLKTVLEIRITTSF